MINPATGGVIASMSKCGAAETRQAIASAGAALRPWRNLTGKERSSILRRWHSEILKHTDDIATLMTLEGGKPLAESRAELQSGAGSVEWMAEEAKRCEIASQVKWHADACSSVARDLKPHAVCHARAPRYRCTRTALTGRAAHAG